MGGFEGVMLYDGTTAGGIAEMITDFGTIFSAVWNFVSGNWALFVFIVIPVCVAVIGAIIGMFSHR